MSEMLLSLAQSVWMPLVVLVLTTVDGIIPMVPSEMVVVALAAVWTSHGAIYLVPLIGLAAVGAFLGDCLAYWIGRVVPFDRLPYLNKPGPAAAFERARSTLGERGAAILITARYIPVARVAANMAAGAVRMKFSRFIRIDLIGSLTWATYTVLLGALAGAWLGKNPFAAAAFGIVLGFIVGGLLDRVISKRQASREAQRDSDRVEVSTLS